MYIEKIEALKTAYEYMPDLYKGIIETIQMFKEGRDEEQAYLNTSQILEGLEWIVQVFVLTRDIQKENIEVEKIEDVLADLLDAMESEDKIFISDLLEYEIMVCLEEWYDELKNILNV